AGGLSGRHSADAGRPARGDGKARRRHAGRGPDRAAGAAGFLWLAQQRAKSAGQNPPPRHPTPRGGPRPREPPPPPPPPPPAVPALAGATGEKNQAPVIRFTTRPSVVRYGFHIRYA